MARARASKVPELDVEDLIQQSRLKVCEVKEMWSKQPKRIPATAEGQLATLILSIERELNDFIKANYWSECGFPAETVGNQSRKSNETNPEQLAEFSNTIYQLQQILTNDELQIVELALKGYRNTEIAQTLDIDHQRVSEHRREIARKAQRRAVRGCADNKSIVIMAILAVLFMSSGFGLAIIVGAAGATIYCLVKRYLRRRLNTE